MDVIGRSDSDREQNKSRSKILQYTAEHQTFACINFSECHEHISHSRRVHMCHITIKQEAESKTHQLS